MQYSSQLKEAMKEIRELESQDEESFMDDRLIKQAKANSLIKTRLVPAIRKRRKAHKAIRKVISDKRKKIQEQDDFAAQLGIV